jgi:hypothetical protein
MHLFDLNWSISMKKMILFYAIAVFAASCSKTSSYVIKNKYNEPIQITVYFSARFAETHKHVLGEPSQQGFVGIDYKWGKKIQGFQMGKDQFRVPLPSGKSLWLAVIGSRG